MAVVAGIFWVYEEIANFFIDRKKEKRQLLAVWRIYRRNPQILHKALEDQYEPVHNWDSPEEIKQKVRNNKSVRYYQKRIKQEFFRKDFDALWKEMSSFWGKSLGWSVEREVERLKQAYKKTKEVEIKEALQKEHGEWY